MNKKIIAVLIALLCLNHAVFTAFASVDSTAETSFNKTTIDQTITIHPAEGDFTNLTLFLEKEAAGFSKNNCLITMIHSGSINSLTVVYTLYYMGCRTPYGVTVKIENGIPCWYYSDIHLFKIPQQEPFGIELINSYNFSSDFIPELEDYIEKNCYNFSKNDNLIPNVTTCEKRIDENNRVYLYFSTEFTENSQLGLTMRESYKYYLDEHKMDVLACLK